MNTNPENDQRQEGGQDGEVGNSHVRLRIWPALLIVIAQVVTTVGLSSFGSTVIQNVVAYAVAPAIALILLIIWWLAASRAPRRDRIIGLVLFIGVLVGIVFTQKELRLGAALLIFAAPALMACAVAWLAVGASVPWGVRRWLAVALMLLCAGAFTVLRVDSVTGTLVPILSWRWTQTADERATALPRLKGGATAVLPAQVSPEDWTGFRGSLRDGRAVGIKFSTNWTSLPRELWRREVGAGWSSFAAVGDYIFTQEQRGSDEFVTCYRADTGENVWANSIHVERKDAMGIGPRATPTFDQGRLYTEGATGVVQCIDAATGKTIWKRDLTKDTDAKVPTWGLSSSPLVVGDFVIVFGGGGEGKNTIAYRRASGDIAWGAGHASGGYSSPHLLRIADVPQIVMNTDAGIQSFDPQTGASLWEYAWKTKGSPRVVQPFLSSPDTILLGSTAAGGTRLLRIAKQESAWSVKEEWETRKFRPYFNDFVLHKDHGYGFDGDRLVCFDPTTGKPVWEGKRYGGQLVLVADVDAMVVLSEKGEVVLVPATPERFTEAASFQAISGKTWNHPVIAHGRLFVRNAEEMACYALPGL